MSKLDTRHIDLSDLDEVDDSVYAEELDRDVETRKAKLVKKNSGVTTTNHKRGKGFVRHDKRAVEA